VTLNCICIAGPTASGKTAAALAVARALAPQQAVEIISVDSALVYRGMDIGTAKPSVAERAAVPHHLIDILDPTESYSAARFVADATRLIAEIAARGNLPLLVGGTMLYFKALFEGLDPMPAADPAVRARIEAEAVERGWPALHAELARVDPPTATRLAPGDTQRIQRALEVFRISGKPLSSFHRERPAPMAMPPLLALEPHNRAWLHQRIGQRLEQMLASGLVDEVRALRARGDLNPGLPAMRCVGYRQAWEALDQNRLGDLGERASAATRQLAKRQLTWLRRMHGRRALACDADDVLAQTVKWVRSSLTLNSVHP
jgi:tRNA dimethylallyltransferase